MPLAPVSHPRVFQLLIAIVEVNKVIGRPFNRLVNVLVHLTAGRRAVSRSVA